jgi:hypothetical protein
MLLRDPSTPATGLRESQWFGFADAHKGIGDDGCYQVKDTECGFAVRLNPVPQIVSKIT